MHANLLTMKKLLFLFSLLLMLSGCKTLTHIPAHEEFFSLDFRPYLEKDFVITPLLYPGDYKIIAMIDYLIMPEANSKTVTNPKTGAIRTIWVQDFLFTSEALDSIYNKCLSMGADGLMNFLIQEHVESYTSNGHPVNVYGKKISGIAIKRED